MIYIESGPVKITIDLQEFSRFGNFESLLFKEKENLPNMFLRWSQRQTSAFANRLEVALITGTDGSVLISSNLDLDRFVGLISYSSSTLKLLACNQSRDRCYFIYRFESLLFNNILLFETGTIQWRFAHLPQARSYYDSELTPLNILIVCFEFYFICMVLMAKFVDIHIPLIVLRTRYLVWFTSCGAVIADLG